jgi:beta-fructofuranosidase
MRSVVSRKLAWSMGLCFMLLCAVNALSSTKAAVAPKEGPYASRTPQYIFGNTLEEQEAQLKENPIVHKFAELRRRQASDPFRPAYHFISPENMMNDPNGLSFWQGRWHLFYQGLPSDSAFSDPKGLLERVMKRQVHWGHAVSDDLVHWRDLPYAIYFDCVNNETSLCLAAERSRDTSVALAR